MDAHTLQTDLIKTLDLIPVSHPLVLLTTLDHHLEVQSPGGNCTVTVRCASIIKRAGQVLLSLPELRETLKSQVVETGIVQLTLNPDGFTVKMGDTLLGLSSQEGHIREVRSGQQQATLPRLFLQQLAKVAPICSPAVLEPGFSCISLEPLEGAKLRLVATDGFRLSMEEVGYSGSLQPCLLPAKHVKLLQLLFKNHTTFQVNLTDGRLHFFTPEATVSVQTPEGPFVGYHHSIPQNTPLEVGLDARSVLKAMQGMAVALKGQAIPGVTLSLGKTGCQLQATTAKGVHAEPIDARTLGTWDRQVELTLDARHLIDAIRQLEPYVILKATGDVKAPVVLSSGDTASLAVLVPLLAS